jgi:curved DNA binding protein
MEQDEKDISTPDVLQKYQAAAEVANSVMEQLIEYIQPGHDVMAVCVYGDRLIDELCAKKYPKLKKPNKGIAFPTCISVNNCASHFAPLPGEPSYTIKAGDAVKIDFGVHFDGYISQCAHTIIVAQNSEEGPLSGRVADAICAAYFAAECAVRLLKPGSTNIDISNAIRKVADIFHVNPLEGVLSHEIKRNLIDGNNVILQRVEVDQNVEEFAFEMNQVYVIDIAMSTGEGKTREVESRTTVFKRAVDRVYQLKVQASRAILSEIQKNAPILPFCLRILDEKKRKFGIVEIVKHDLLDTYPVLYEKPGETVVQFKFTALILPESTERLNNFTLPHVTSEYSIESDPEIQEIMALSTQRGEEKKPKKKKTTKKKGKQEPEQEPEGDMETDE